MLGRSMYPKCARTTNTRSAYVLHLHPRFEPERYGFERTNERQEHDALFFCSLAQPAVARHERNAIGIARQEHHRPLRMLDDRFRDAEILIERHRFAREAHVPRSGDLRTTSSRRATSTALMANGTHAPWKNFGRHAATNVRVDRDERGDRTAMVTRSLPTQLRRHDRVKRNRRCEHRRRDREAVGGR